MPFKDFMTKVRHFDNLCARWMMRHFYIVFFEFVLVFIFFIFFFNILRNIDLAAQITTDNLTEKLLLQQSTNTLIIIVLLLLNSFWMLYIFNGMNRLRIILKDISFALSRRRQQ
ncbi:MAG: hypothetical protein KAJ18_07920 [Candidatus Omnitrophica bacterium]|nr:hypothetical protein [Candidatus Omnitrophota bacterium]